MTKRKDLTGWEIDEFGMRKGTRKIDLTLSNPEHGQTNGHSQDRLILRIEEVAIEVDLSNLLAALEPFKAEL